MTADGHHHEQQQQQKHHQQQRQQQQQQQQQQLLQLVDLGIQASLHQLVVTGVLHADPHPGNLLLSGGKLVYLDFGLLVKVPPQASLVSRGCHNLHEHEHAMTRLTLVTVTIRG
jgi:Ser/Thr protein kinase RdoA (MazF antagonist)